MKEEPDCERICDKKILKTKIKSSSDKATENHDKEILKVGSNYTC